MRNIYVIEELMQLIVGWNKEIIANSHCTEDFTFLSNTLKAARLVLNRVHAYAP